VSSWEKKFLFPPDGVYTSKEGKKTYLRSTGEERRATEKGWTSAPGFTSSAVTERVMVEPNTKTERKNGLNKGKKKSSAREGLYHNGLKDLGRERAGGGGVDSL